MPDMTASYPLMFIEMCWQVTDGVPVVEERVTPSISRTGLRKLTATTRPAAVTGIGKFAMSAARPVLPPQVTCPCPTTEPVEPIPLTSPSQSTIHGQETAD